jgi:hypothetical protein
MKVNVGTFEPETLAALTPEDVPIVNQAIGRYGQDVIGAAFANNGKSPKVKRPAVESERKATPPQSGQKPQEVAEQVGDTVDVATNNGVRSADELLTNGRVPSVRNGEFSRWFDDLSPAELDNLWANDAVRTQIERRIRQPGGLHEWCMACRAPEFRRWGVSMDETQRLELGAMS